MLLVQYDFRIEHGMLTSSALNYFNNELDLLALCSLLNTQTAFDL